MDNTQCPNCMTGEMVPDPSTGDAWCNACEISAGDAPKCPMCGVPFGNHPGLTELCRRYHWQRTQLQELIAEAQVALERMPERHDCARRLANALWIAKQPMPPIAGERQEAPADRSRGEGYRIGTVAKILNERPITIRKWFDDGRIRGYRKHGSNERIIPHDALMEFVRVHNLEIK